MTDKIKRNRVIDLPEGQSTFLWGARKTGKTTYLKQHFPKAYYIDLLRSDLYVRYIKEPYRFREEVLAHLELNPLEKCFIVDEVQKVPALLDEIHYLIENSPAQFILCGSSARKLRKKGVNLLGGRAWKYRFFPLVAREIGPFDLLKALNYGLIPSHYLGSHPRKSLQAYVEDYLIYEIQHEGLVRNIGAFTRFLDVASYSHGQCVNYANIARDCGVDAKTVKEYFTILNDTLISYEILPYRKRGKRHTIIQMPKFYFFDSGIVNTLTKRTYERIAGADIGHIFEGYILHEVKAYKHLREKEFDIAYWRTKSGREVDFILGLAEVALEVKTSRSIDKQDLKGLEAFMEENPTTKGYVVCLEESPRKVFISESNREIWIWPYGLFLERLWKGEII
jgi:predicted AAA+ superfamily ATPase